MWPHAIGFLKISVSNNLKTYKELIKKELFSQQLGPVSACEVQTTHCLGGRMGRLSEPVWKCLKHGAKTT